MSKLHIVIDGFGQILLCLLLALVCGGCANTKFYPICIIDTIEVPVEIVWAQSKPFIAESIQKAVLGGSLRTALDATGATVSGFEWEHESLRGIWPSIACVIATRGFASDIHLRQCQEDMRRYFSEGWSSWPGATMQASSICTRYIPGL